MLRRSTLMDKVVELKTSRNSVEVSQLAETAFNNLKVSACIILLLWPID